GDQEEPPPSTPIFYGGISVYLEQASALFRHMPRPLYRTLNAPALLRWVSRFAIETRPENLGAMTVSVLAGRDGRQRAELDRLLEFLESGPRPNLVSLTNSLLSGIAPEVQRRLRVPVVCSLQGEDAFVEAMGEPHRARAVEWMRANAASIALFFAPGEAYRQRMAAYLEIPLERVRLVRPGINLEAFQVSPAPPPRFTVGYLSVITPGKGLDVLVEAVRILVREEGRPVKLRVAGRILNKHYWESVLARIGAYQLDLDFEYLGELGFAEKREMLRTCSAFSVPSRFHECRGMAVLEAMAVGTPVAVPASGVYPEVIKLTEGGELFRPEDPADLARALGRLMDSPERAVELGRKGAQGVARYFDARRMAQEVADACATLLPG
ncbi:MAG: glycosyltransferase family 4 protein, partial [Armatimonadota bacterium]|nr:glycosyltransferase family 4 protein [Armatimonadota bacterium]